MKTRFIIIALCLVLAAQAQKTIPADSWMGSLNAVIGNKPLQAIVLPGAYKSGLHRITGNTGVPDRCNSQSQDTTVQGLLDRGVRYLDLTAIHWRDGHWYLGSYTYTRLFGMQMAVGQSLESALSEIAGFLSDKRHSQEIVLIHLSAYEDCRNKKEPRTLYGDLDSLKKESLQLLVSERLAPFLFKKAEPLRATPNQILATVHSGARQRTGAALVLFNNQGAAAMRPGIYRSDHCESVASIPLKVYSERTELLATLSQRWSSWQKRDECCYTICQWVLTWRSTDNPCNRELFGNANTELGKLLPKATPGSLPQVLCVGFANRELCRQIIGLNTKP